MESARASIRFFSEHVTVRLKNIRQLKKFIHSIAKKEGRNVVDLNYIVCSDRDVLGINQEYLGHDFYTDVVSFDLSPGKRDLLAEIYISYDRVKDNAKTYRVPLQHELHRVIFHGLLHLCGYDDKTERDLRKMKRRENAVLASYLKIVSQ